MWEKSMLIPPYGAAKFASRLEPPENGTAFIRQRRLSYELEHSLIGILYLWQTFAIFDTSSVDLGYATAVGSLSMLIVEYSE
jgi:hypothetical protein